MSKLLIDWLNDLGLSQKVSTLETVMPLSHFLHFFIFPSFTNLQDLKNGFLLGEVLYLHNQLQTYHQLSTNNNSDAQIRNFCLLEPVLRAMGIRFDAQTAFAVMKGRPGAASTVLYKVMQYVINRSSTP
jgi:hypothetical protein